MNQPTNTQIMFEIDNLHQGWTDNAIMLDCGDKELEYEIECYALEMQDLFINGKEVDILSLVEDVADYLDIYEKDNVIPLFVYHLVNKALDV